MSTALQDLLALQDLDLTLDQLRHRRAHLPERADLARLEAEAAAAAGQLQGVESARAELATRQAGTEAELAASEARSAAIDKRLYSGDVSAPRDLQAMAAELDQLKARASALEDAVLEALEEAEPLDARAAELRASLTALAGTRAGVEDRLATAEQEIDAELSSLQERRAGAASSLPAPLLATYERLRGRLGGVGVARLVGSHCDGCHLALSAVELDRLRHLPDGELFTCEQCSRILVP